MITQLFESSMDEAHGIQGSRRNALQTLLAKENVPPRYVRDGRCQKYLVMNLRASPVLGKQTSRP
jgi:hypothetical protein